MNANSPVFRINQEGYAPGLPVRAAVLAGEPVILKNACGKVLRRLKAITNWSAAPPGAG